MDIISRKEWGARRPKARTGVSWSARTEFIVHYSEGPTTQTVRSIQDFHMGGRGWSDIGYNFLVDVQGRIYEGRGWLTVGAHAPGHNSSGVGVCMIGRDGDATPAAERAIRWLYDEAVRRAGRNLTKLGHRDVYATSCPGDQLYAWVRAGMPADTEEDDVSAKDVWDEPIDTGDGGKPWRARTVLGHLEKSQDRIEAKVDAGNAAVAELSKALAALAADRGQEIDADALIARIKAEIERVTVHLDVTGEETAS